MPLTITPANVAIYDGNATINSVQVGEAVAQGQVGMRDSTVGFGLARSNDETKSLATHIYLTPAASGGWAQRMKKGNIIIGATLVLGKSYFLGTTGGQIISEDELASTNWVTLLGVAISTSVLAFDPKPYRVQFT